MWVGFDVESWGDGEGYGLQPWRVEQGTAWLRSWATDSEKGGTTVTVAPRDRDACAARLSALLDSWIEQEATVVGWNVTFDLGWLIAYGLYDKVRQVKWMDGMLLLRHFTNGPEYTLAGSKRRSYGLKAAVAEFYPQFKGYDEAVDFDGNLLHLMEYNGVDAMLTRYIAMHLYGRLGMYHPRRLRAAKIESHCIPMIARANVTGIPIDREYVCKLDGELTDEIDEVSAKLAQNGLDRETLASPAQLATRLYSDRGNPVQITTDKGAPSTNKEALIYMAGRDPIARDVLTYRELVNLRTKFVSKLRQSVDYNGDGRSRPAARIFGTYSGRMTYASTTLRTLQTGWALHQMKRAARFRRQVIAPPGHQLVELDASGQEFRWMAVLSGDPTMVHLCRPGEDPHAYMGAQCSNLPYADVREGHEEDDRLKMARQMGKVANLSLQYRTSAKTLLKVARIQFGMMWVDEAMAQMIHRTYRRTYSEVPKYWDRQISQIHRDRYVETLAGRVVTISDRDLRGSAWSVDSTAINFPVQGTGADQKYLAMSVLRPVMQNYGAQLMIDLHDGLYFAVPEHNVIDFIRVARYALDNLPYQKAWGFTPNVPLPWDAKVGDNWGDMKGVAL